MSTSTSNNAALAAPSQAPSVLPGGAHLFARAAAALDTCLDQLVEEGALPAHLPRQALTAEPPRDPAHGDIALNAAMVCAKAAKQNPRDLAALLTDKLRRIEGIAEASVAGPGFINLTLDPALWREQVVLILESGPSYGNALQKQDEPVNIEYVSANPTGPLHIGHARGAVIGDALARLLEKAGHSVTREYYVNDAGAQVDVLARSAYLRYREALGESVTIPEGYYPGDYLKPIGEALAEQYGDALRKLDEPQWLPPVRTAAIAAMLELIREDLKRLGIRHDMFSSEAALVTAGKPEAALATLEEKGLIYTGVLEPPKGKPVPEDWEATPQTLFRSTDFGDDLDRAIRKSDGSWTYFTPDISLHYDKYRRGFKNMINVFGADHGGYVKRLKAAVAALTGGEGQLDILLCQMVNLLENGTPIKMSKRAGNFVTVRDLVEEVGPDVLRFIMLTRKHDAPLDFDVEKVKEQSRENPVFYVQYAHARAHSALRLAEESMPEAAAQSAAPSPAILARLTQETETALIRKLASWPRQVEQAARHHEPHRIAFYLQELAAAFHELWTQGKTDPALRFVIQEDPELTTARLALLRAAATVLASGLHVIGVTPMTTM